MISKKDTNANKSKAAPQKKTVPSAKNKPPAKKPPAAKPPSAANKTAAAGKGKIVKPEEELVKVPTGTKGSMTLKEKDPKYKKEKEYKKNLFEKRDREIAKKKKAEDRRKKKKETQKRRAEKRAEDEKKKAEERKNNQDKAKEKLSPKERKQVERSKKKGEQKKKEKHKKQEQERRTEKNKDQKRLEEKMNEKPQTKEQEKLQKQYRQEQAKKDKEKKKQEKAKENKKPDTDVTAYELKLAEGKIPFLEGVGPQGVTVGGSYEGERGKASGQLEVNKVDSNYELSASIGKDGVKLGGEVSAGYYAARGEGKAEYELMNGVSAHVEGSGYVGAAAEASASADLSWGKRGPNVNAEAEAGAYLAKGEVSGGFNIFGIDIKGTAEGQIGAGVEAGIGLKDGVFHANIGAALGIGGSLGVEIDFSEAIDNATEFFDENKERIGDAIDTVGDTIGGAVDAVGDTVGGAVDAVKGWFGW